MKSIVCLEVNRCRIRGKCEEFGARRRPCKCGVRSGFETKGRCHQKTKTGVSLAFVLQKVLKNNTCVNARDIPTMAHQVLHQCPTWGYLPWLEGTNPGWGTYPGQGGHFIPGGRYPHLGVSPRVWTDWKHNLPSCTTYEVGNNKLLSAHPFMILRFHVRARSVWTRLNPVVFHTYFFCTPSGRGGVRFQGDYSSWNSEDEIRAENRGRVVCYLILFVQSEYQPLAVADPGFPRGAKSTLEIGRQPIIRPIFLKTAWKWRKYGPRGVHLSRPLDLPTSMFESAIPSKSNIVSINSKGLFTCSDAITVTVASLSKFNIVLMVTGRLTGRMGSRPILPVTIGTIVKLDGSRNVETGLGAGNGSRRNREVAACGVKILFWNNTHRLTLVWFGEKIWHCLTLHHCWILTTECNYFVMTFSLCKSQIKVSKTVSTAVIAKNGCHFCESM